MANDFFFMANIVIDPMLISDEPNSSTSDSSGVHGHRSAEAMLSPAEGTAPATRESFRGVMIC